MTAAQANESHRRMRILFVNYEYPPLGGGAGNATRELARRLAARGHAAAVLTTRFRGQGASGQDEGVTLIRLRSPRRKIHQCSPAEMLAFIALGMARGPALARPFLPEIVLAFFALPSGAPARRIARALSIPYVVCVRGGDVPRPYKDELARLHALARPALRRVWRGAAAIVANSQGLAAMARQFENSRPTLTIPNGVDTARFRPAPPPGPDGEPREIALFAAGRLSVEKGLDALLQALAGMPKSLPPWRLRIAGDGPLRGALERQARQLGLAERVEFLGWKSKEDMPECYRAQDAFALVSSGEGSPNVILEAQACGLAVVATRVRGVDELIRHETDGLLVEHGDQAGLREALARIVGDSALRRRLGREARRSAESRSWEEAAFQFERLCRKILAGENPANGAA